MEIIKKGNPDRAWWRVNQPVRFECDLCGCQWEAVRGEYQVVSDYRNGACYGMECPCCKHTVWGRPMREEDESASGRVAKVAHRVAMDSTAVNATCATRRTR